jgi:hypothetical protein
MKPSGRIGQTAVALVVSAVAGLILGIFLYMGRESFGYQYRWGSYSPELQVLWAIQFALVCSVALFVFLFQKVRFFPGSLYVLLILLVPPLLTAYFLHSLLWLVVVPLGIIAVLLMAAIPRRKRKVTVEQFADELERHLLATEGKWDWDDTTSLAIADERLEQIRWRLPKLDSLTQEKDKDELRAIIVALRRGELPEVVPPTYLTYRAQ